MEHRDRSVRSVWKAGWLASWLTECLGIGREHSDEIGRILQTRCDVAYSVVLDLPSNRVVVDLEKKCTEVFSVLCAVRRIDCRFLAKRVDDPAVNRQLWMLFVAFNGLVAEDYVQTCLWDIVGDDGQFTHFDRYCRRAGVQDGCDGDVVRLRMYIGGVFGRAQRWVERHPVLKELSRKESQFGDSVHELFAIMHRVKWNCRKQARDEAMAAAKDRG